MRKSIILLSTFLMLSGGLGYSQSRSAGFNEFRNRGLANFQKFRERILEQYADFLNGEWHEFEAIMEEESPYTEPKPEAIPICDIESNSLVTNMMMTCLPDPSESSSSLAGALSAQSVGVPSSEAADGQGKKAFKPSDAKGKSNYELALKGIPDPNFAFGPFPGQTKAPAPNVTGMLNSDGKYIPPKGDFHFDFYGMDAFIPDIDFEIADNINSSKETGDHWKRMAAQKGGVETARHLFGLAQQLGLNGYLTYRLAESYVNQKFKNSNDKARTSAMHFLMSNMGYDIRLADLGNSFAVMMPFDQNIVYGMIGCTLDGRRYSLILPEGNKRPQIGSIYTCPLPSDALGKTSDLRLTGLNLPMKPKAFEVSQNGITIKGNVNENIKKLLHRYPQMSAGDFASSWIDKDLRDDIVAQVKAQLEGMEETQAINTLMSLCHYGFDYSTDQKYHGFEKPYFVEENFIYDYNDCEDRAIFFSYLVWNALGLPCQLIQYPGHESVTIATASNIDGCYYNTDGSKYYSSDPTYRGSRIGMVIDKYQKTAPVIHKQYR